MGRRRYELEDGLHHVTTRAPKGLVLFRDGEDNQAYLDLLGDEIVERGWSLRSYCLMVNHLHLLVATPATDLGAGLKAVHERFAIRSHRKNASYGHVFGARFDNRIVGTAEYEAACLRYIARNPVKARMVEAAGEWRWSAHRFLVGDASPPRWLDVDGAFTAIGRGGYRELVEAGDAALLEALRSSYPETWMARAFDDYRISIAEIGTFAGLRRTAAYKHLARARAARG